MEMMLVNQNDPNPAAEHSENQTQWHQVKEEDVLCDRCSMPMFRMRAVYWCEGCGYKTDCCGH